jgi:hypothetical protein
MSRGYGYIFIKWTKYYIVGKVFEADLTREITGEQHGNADFQIVYFGDHPPDGVKADTFGDSNLQFIPRDTRIKLLTSLLAQEVAEKARDMDIKPLAIDITPEEEKVH